MCLSTFRSNPVIRIAFELTVVHSGIKTIVLNPIYGRRLIRNAPEGQGHILAKCFLGEEVFCQDVSWALGRILDCLCHVADSKPRLWIRYVTQTIQNASEGPGHILAKYFLPQEAFSQNVSLALGRISNQPSTIYRIQNNSFDSAMDHSQFKSNPDNRIRSECA